MNIVVTGANRGIGLELCRLLAERGDNVVGACRSSSQPLADLSVQVVENVDVTDDESVAALAAALGDKPVDWLINNAGILSVQTLANMDWSAMRKQFEVNSLGPLRVTTALLGNFVEGSKVGIVTSRMGSIADNGSGSSYGYRMSKAAVNMAGVSLARDLADRKIAVALLHPGYVRTEMTGGSGFIDPDEAARGLIARMDELGLESSGTFWHSNGETLPW